MGSVANAPQGIDVHHHFIPECYAKGMAVLTTKASCIAPLTRHHSAA